jgi:hypothetical protein
MIVDTHFSGPLQPFKLLFQVFNYKDALLAVLEGFDKTQANVTKIDMFIAISKRRVKGMGRRLGRAKRVVAAEVGHHTRALEMLYGYKIVVTMKNVTLSLESRSIATERKN